MSLTTIPGDWDGSQLARVGPGQAGSSTFSATGWRRGRVGCKRPAIKRASRVDSVTNAG